jgi:hypothetical protein
VAPLFAEAIRRIHNWDSISERSVPRLTRPTYNRGP